MKLAELTWPEVEALDRDKTVVLIPTGSLEQHGEHLPLFTDSILATAVAEATEQNLAASVLLTPTLWLGASGHHLAFAGTLSASFEAYIGALQSVVSSLAKARFRKFFVVNGHGGNSEPNGVALRQLKEANPELMLGHLGYFAPLEAMTQTLLEGRLKGIRHACEAEVSLMMHVAPHLVRTDKLRNDGLIPDPAIAGMIHLFDEMTERGSYGDAPCATAEKGKVLFDTAVAALTENLQTLSEGYALLERE